MRGVGLWTLILRGLQALSLDKRPEVRDRAIAMLFETLRQGQFTAGYWEDIYELILGYVPNTFLHLLQEDFHSSEFVRGAVVAVVELFAEHFDLLASHCAEFSERLSKFISTSDEVP